MSFSYDCKKEIFSFQRRDCCNQAFLYGLFAFSGSFDEGLMRISLPTRELIDLMLYMFEKLGYSVGNTKLISGRRSITVVLDEDVSDRLLTDLGFSGHETAIRIDRSGFVCENCAASFIAGAFCGAGSVTKPNSGYHLEISTYRQSLFNDFVALLTDAGFSPKTIHRGYTKVVYFKESSSIEDMLTYMGAYEGSMKLMDHKIYKELRNNVNRRLNCESANIDKAVAAAMSDIGDINYILQTKGEGYLPEELLEIAKLRLKNPELSLAELGELVPGGLTKSGTSHRMAKIRKEAKLLREEAANGN